MSLMYKEITVVMYHYVRNFSATRYPGLKGLDINDFKQQLEFLENNYTFVTIEDCLEYLKDPSSVVNFPNNAVLLTFDDGYIEHFTEVFPILNSRGIQGVFFPPVRSSGNREALDVNKIHYILAESPEPDKLIHKLSFEIEKYKRDFNLMDPQSYYESIDTSEHPYDSSSVIKFKRVLQRELPLQVRETIIESLFEEIVGLKEDVFVNELYMTEDHLRCMSRNGMYIGGHGFSHDWLNRVDTKTKEFEIAKTREFLDYLGLDVSNWIMSYPYGAYDLELIEILKKHHCGMAFTTKDLKGVLDPRKRFSIARIDTNEVC